MADIRCPMCGKPNPADNETCQYCQARLKPLISEPFIEPEDLNSQPPDSSKENWLSDLRSAVPAESSFEASDSSSDTSDFEDWFSRLDEPADAETRISTEEPLKPGKEVLPDWLDESGVTPTVPSNEEQEPDWMQQFKKQTFDEVTFGPEKSDEVSGTIDTTDWLSSLGSGSTPTEEETKLGELAEPTTEIGETQDWFSKLGVPHEEKATGATPAFVINDEDISPFVAGDEIAAAKQVPSELESLPDWLSQVSEEQPASTPKDLSTDATPPSQLESEAESDILPAQLPAWLEAMRPVESVVPTTPLPDESTSSLETAGPLAGLRGILPVEAEIARIRKPPVYSVKLQIPEAHQARVSLLEEMVAGEGVPKPVAPYKAIHPQTLLRLTIALFLILAVFGALFVGGKWTPLPDPQSVPQELEDLRGQIEALPSNAPVLVSFDYEPGFSGEMEATASSVISHLVEKRVPLLFVSTNPLGPALAERMMKQQVDDLNSQILLGTVPYTTSLFKNLGYIPGGITGLRAFAETPARIFPRSLEQQEIWVTASLTPAATLASFNMVLVVTDNPDTAQAWIEQAQPLLESSPLLMVLSAQAEPMIRPYYDSGQVQGMVTGLAGGAAYENKRGRPGLASDNWDVFSATLLVATLLILIGSFINASLASLARNKRKGEEQPYA